MLFKCIENVFSFEPGHNSSIRHILGIFAFFGFGKSPLLQIEDKYTSLKIERDIFDLHRDPYEMV